MTVNISISLKLTVYLLTVVCLEKVLMTALDICTGVGICEGAYTGGIWHLKSGRHSDFQDIVTSILDDIFIFNSMKRNGYLPVRTE